MARRNNTEDIVEDVEGVEDVDLDETDLDVDDIDLESEEDETEGGDEEKPAKPKKEKKGPARGELLEGFVTPVTLAKVLTERRLHTNREGEVVEVKPQMVYSYIKNAPKDHAFPMQKVTDSLGKERNAVNLEEGIAWWEAKNERAKARKENAAAKATKKAEKPADVVEAEDDLSEDSIEGVDAE